jgi:hypothetical protein
MTASPTTLAYADLPARWGVTVQRELSAVRIVVPPVPGWRFLPIGLQIAIPLLTLITAACVWSFTIATDWSASLFNTGLYGSVLLLVLAAAVHRLRNRYVLEVDSEKLTIARLLGRSRRLVVACPRPLVVEVKHSSINGMLFLHVGGHDFIELPVSPNAAISAWVAEQLRIALETVPLAVETAAVVQRGPETLVLNRRTQVVLLSAAGVMTCAGTAMLFMGATPRFIGAFLILFAILPVGIVFGTQPSKFWT